MLLVVGLLLCAVWGVALGLSAIRMVREGWELWYVLVHVGLLAVSLLAFGAVAVSGDELSRRHAGLEEARASALESELETLRADYANLNDMYHERRGSHHFTRVTENTSHALPREQMLQVPVGRTVEPEDEGQPVAVFTKALDGMQCDWGAVQRAARSIRTPGYSLHAFHVDCRTAFPELTLYVVSRGGERKPGQSDVSSGVDAQAEYLRTMGALFAVYWLCRIGIDGERGFSFGVGDDWLPREPPPADSDVPDELKRLQFFEKQEWGGLQQLFVDAGILTRGKISGTFTPNVERVAGILVLTAIHDIMKIEALLPKVTEAQRCRADGFKPGDTINDHDLALGYVLDHWPWCLPSFAALPPAQQKSVAFTQSKMGFNHGWLVQARRRSPSATLGNARADPPSSQAEAPPSALFSSFKQVIASEGVAAEDISFYFVHWVTDLAGAVPSPLEGSEKFVLKFPHPVRHPRPPSSPAVPPSPLPSAPPVPLSPLTLSSPSPRRCSARSSDPSACSTSSRTSRRPKCSRTTWSSSGARTRASSGPSRRATARSR